MEAVSAAVGEPDAHTAEIWTWNPQSRDFDAVVARRVQADQYEVVRGRGRHATGTLQQGDVVHCELSEGELIVRERVFSSTLL